MSRAIYTWLDKQASLKRFYAQLQKENDVVQVTVTNHTKDIRKVCLWGAIACTPLTDPMFINEEGIKSVIVDKQPQELVYNVVTDLFYVVNQLGDSVSVVNPSGELVTTIDLLQGNSQTDSGSGIGERRAVNPTILSVPGSISPVALAVNTSANSVEYGVVAVACSVSNEVVFINRDFSILRREAVGNRPVDIVYNPVDQCYYTANLVSGTISKICINRRVNNLPLVPGARTLGVDTDSGDLYLHNIVDGAINVYDLQGNQKGSVGSVVADIVSFQFHPVTKNMYMVLNNSNSVSVLDTVRFGAITKLSVGKDPVAIAYNPHNGLMYVGNRGDQTFSRISPKHQVIDTIKTESFGLGLAISSKEDIIGVSNSADDTVSISGLQSGPTVTVNEEYYEDREDFQHNPAMVGHVKLVASGEDRINALQITEKSVTGTEICKTISLSNSHSPQNFANVSEVFDFDGNLIDGHVTWCFKINPLQQVSFLIYYNQIEMYNLLPEKSRISTGVQMSKGIPVSWLNNPKDEPPNVTTY